MTKKMYFRLFSSVFACAAFCAQATQNVKFPKDQRMDIMFPPIIELPPSPGLPLGHLRPLGRQQRSSGQVRVNINETWNMKETQVFKKIVNYESLFHIWSKEDADLDESVLIRKRPMNGETKHEAMSLASFIEDYGSEEWLLDQVVPVKLLDNIKIPDAFKCLSGELLHISSSLTSGTTSDDIKISSFPTLQCVLQGRRDYIVLSKSQTIPTSPSSHPHNICGFDSVVNLNPDTVNVFDNPWVIPLVWHHAKLMAGDCILLPADTAAHTTSYGPKCETVTYSWHPSINCSNENDGDKTNKVSPLLCANSENQRLELCDKGSPEKWRALLKSLVSSSTGVLSKHCFAELFYDEVEGENMYELFETIPVTVDAISELSDTTLRKMIKSAYTKTLSHSHQHDEL